MAHRPGLVPRRRALLREVPFRVLASLARDVVVAPDDDPGRTQAADPAVAVWEPRIGRRHRLGRGPGATR